MRVRRSVHRLDGALTRPPRLADHLPAVLAAAVSERNMPKRFREWLAAAHRECDRGTCFAVPAPPAVQAAMRRALGDEGITLFERATGALATHPTAELRKGDVITLRAAGTVLGRVLGFLALVALDKTAAAAAAAEPGGFPYSGGDVVVAQLPAAMHGSEPRRFALRRVTAHLDAAAAAAAEAAELARAPKRIVLIEPLAWAAGLDAAGAGGSACGASFPAGAALVPVMRVAVHSAGGKPLRHALLGGVSTPVSVTQALRFLGEAEAPAEEVVCSYLNTTPGAGGAFGFLEMRSLARAGRYELCFTAAPCVGGEALSLSVPFTVLAGPPADVLPPPPPPPAAPPPRLGRPAPPLAIAYCDAHGNAIAARLPKAYPKPQLAAAPAGVRVAFRATRAPAGGARLEAMRFQGSAGMTLFQGADSAATPALVTLTLSCAGAPAAAARNQHAWPQPLLPGLPAALEVLPPLPDGRAGGWAPGAAAAGDQGAPRVAAGAALPPLRVRCLDAWGNPTAPVEGVRPGWRLALSGAALAGGAATLRFDAHGVADVDAAPRPLRAAAAAAAADEAAALPLLLRVEWEGAEEEAAPMEADADADADADAAAAEASPVAALPAPPELRLSVRVAATRAPARMVLQLPARAVMASDGDGARAVLQLCGADVVAGSTLTPLSLALLDGAGQPCCKTPGTLRVSWAPRPERRQRAAKGAAAPGDIAFVFDEATGCSLPPLAVPTEAGTAHAAHFIRFTPDDPSAPPVEADVVIVPCAGAAVAWRLQVVAAGEDADADAGAAADADADADADAADGPIGGPTPGGGIAAVACGAACVARVDAVDVHHNRCDAAGLPAPRVAPDDAAPDAPRLSLMLDDAAPGAWGAPGSRGANVFRLPMALGGVAGDVRLVASDAAGALRADMLTLELAPGPPAALEFAGAPAAAAAAAEDGALTCAPRAVLRALGVQLCDAWGNAAAPPAGAGGTALEVVLCATAAAAADDTITASVAPAVGKPHRRLDARGAATFGDVRLAAPGPGRFALCAQLGAAASADGAPLAGVPPALLTVAVAATNRVTALQPRLRPPEGAEEEEEGAGGAGADAAAAPSYTYAAGCVLRCDVAFTTEDGEAPPAEAAEGVTLTLQPPPAPDTDAGVGGATAADLAPMPLACAGVCEDGRLAFTSLPLRRAGEYTLRCEYKEARRSLAATLTATERRAAAEPLTIRVAAGPPTALRLATLPPDAQLAASNSGAEADRLLMRRAVLALTDAHGNEAPPPSGASVLASLAWREGEAPPQGAALPSIDGDAKACTQRFARATGRATFPPLALEPDTGAMPPGADAPLRCVLRFALVLRPGGGDAEGGAPSVALDVPVSVTDRAALLAALLAAAERQTAAAAAQRAQRSQLSAVKAAAVAARRARDAAVEHARAAAQRLGLASPGRGGPGAAGAPTATAVAARLAEAVAAAAAAAPRGAAAAPRLAKRGHPHQRGTSGGPSLARALDSCLRSREAAPGIVGGIAELAYVEDDALCRMLSWQANQRMLMCVTKDRGTLMQLRNELRAGLWKDAPVCSFVSLDMINPTPATSMTVADALRRYAVPGEPPAAAAQRRAWLRDAAADGDANPLLRLSLPHQQSGAAAFPATGLIAHAINLLRPTKQGHRRTVWHSVFADMLVFDTLASASAYRAAATAAGVRCATLISLDCERIQASGITDGARPPPAHLKDMDCHFGSAPADAREEGGEEGGGDEEVEALRTLLALCQAAQKAERALQHAVDAVQATGEAGAALSPPPQQQQRGGGAAKRAAPADAEEDEASPQQQLHKSGGCAAALHACLASRLLTRRLSSFCATAAAPQILGVSAACAPPRSRRRSPRRSKSRARLVEPRRVMAARTSNLCAVTSMRA